MMNLQFSHQLISCELVWTSNEAFHKLSHKYIETFETIIKIAEIKDQTSLQAVFHFHINIII